MKKTIDSNRFEDFFAEDTYHLLKNHLYNYTLRKAAILATLKNETLESVLEVGSGISPIITQMNNVVYSDLSLAAVQTLKNRYGNGCHVVADSTRLPFKKRVFSHVICSEVLEHIEDDRAAIREMAGVLEDTGKLTLTFPHGKYYFAIDDRLVHHHRRYDLVDIEEKLISCGFVPAMSRKVLGPLEKITMMAVAGCYRLVRGRGRALPSETDAMTSSMMRKLTTLLIGPFKWANKGYAALAWLDARIMPRCLSTVLLMKCGLRRRSR